MLVPAHGLGGADDLPIPAFIAIGGAGAALTVSFAVLILAWRQPRFDGHRAGVPVPGRLAALIDSGALIVVTRCIGMVTFGYVAWAAFWGPDVTTNPVFGVIYALVWVGIVPASLFFGQVWRAFSPARTLHWLISRGRGPRANPRLLAMPDWVGYWPAACGLFAFVWLELVSEDAVYLTPVRLWFTLYFVVVLVGAQVFGEEWIERADPFEAFSTLISNLSPVGRRADGALVWQSPLSHLDALRPSAGLVAMVAVLLGSTAFDSFSNSPTWFDLVAAVDIDTSVLATLVLLGFCIFVAVSFSLATMAAGSPNDEHRSELPAQFAHSVVPIIVGYMVAHYLTLFVEFGQQTLIYLSDPMVDGSNLLGTADWEVQYVLSTHPTLLAVIKALAVLGGHILGVIAAHDRAVKLLPRRQQIAGQLPLLLVMVTYTVGGLYLLLNA